MDEHLPVLCALGKVERTRSLGTILYNRSRCGYGQYKCSHHDNLDPRSQDHVFKPDSAPGLKMYLYLSTTWWFAQLYFLGKKSLHYIMFMNEKFWITHVPPSETNNKKTDQCFPSVAKVPDVVTNILHHLTAGLEPYVSYQVHGLRINVMVSLTC